MRILEDRIKRADAAIQKQRSPTAEKGLLDEDECRVEEVLRARRMGDDLFKLQVRTVVHARHPDLQGHGIFLTCPWYRLRRIAVTGTKHLQSESSSIAMTSRTTMLGLSRS